MREQGKLKYMVMSVKVLFTFQNEIVQLFFYKQSRYHLVPLQKIWYTGNTYICFCIIFVLREVGVHTGSVWPCVQKQLDGVKENKNTVSLDTSVIAELILTWLHLKWHLKKAIGMQPYNNVCLNSKERKQMCFVWLIKNVINRLLDE